MNAAVSDETLHAFVDGELDVADSEALIARMRDDRELAERVCGLRSLRSMVKLAYVEPPTANRRRMPPPRRRLMQRCAYACLFLFAGLSGGWVLRGLEPQTLALAPAADTGHFQPVSLAGLQADPNRILLHLDTAAPVRMKAVLDEAERLLEEAERQGRAMQLEVIANGQGLDLLRTDRTPDADRIARMQQRHANLHWVACGQTVARFTHEGQKVELLPVAKTAPTAIGEIVTRLQQGWTYVRV